MRILTSSELLEVSGGSRIPGNNTYTTVVYQANKLNKQEDSGSGGGGSTNPMTPGSGSATDEAVQSFRDGNIFTGIGQMIGGAPEILGNGLDGAVRGIGDAFYNHVNGIYQSYHPRTESEQRGLRPALPAN